MWTLAIYLLGTGLTAFTPKGTNWIFYLYATRIIAGMGNDGEYSAINSAIDSMMPARYRGRTDIWINGTYWLGAILGTFASFLLLSSLTSAGPARRRDRPRRDRPVVGRYPDANIAIATRRRRGGSDDHPRRLVSRRRR